LLERIRENIMESNINFTAGEVNGSSAYSDYEIISLLA
jgi:hypothetical protein